MAKKAATLVFTGSCVEGLRAADGGVVDLAGGLAWIWMTSRQTLSAMQ